jgi:hypothetical protein
MPRLEKGASLYIVYYDFLDVRREREAVGKGWCWWNGEGDSKTYLKTKRKLTTATLLP